MTSQNQLQALLNRELRPIVREIDEQGVYPEQFLKRLGQAGLYSMASADNLRLIREVAEVCVSTAFAVWCQSAAISFVQNGSSDELKRGLLPALLAGEVLGGTGISNAMKSYAGMEDLRLAGEQTETGYSLNGTLPFVSNLGPNGWFGLVFRVGETQRAMAVVSCDREGLGMKEVRGFLGLNGTATYSCQFQNVNIPQAYILTENADELIAKIRPGFLLTQSGLSLGLTRSSLAVMSELQGKQNSANRFLKQQPEELAQRFRLLGDRVHDLAERPAGTKEYFKEVVRARLDSAYLALDAAQAEMLHSGVAGYVAGSATSRRLREAYFLAVVTPAVKQLEKMLQSM